jgi:hypothetical protein
LTAFRAGCGGFSANPQRARALRLACFAALGIVLELLILEKELFTCGEDEFPPAINALQNPVNKFHAHGLPMQYGTKANSGVDGSPQVVHRPASLVRSLGPSSVRVH